MMGEGKSKVALKKTSLISKKDWKCIHIAQFDIEVEYFELDSIPT